MAELLRMEGITKQFGAVYANKDINLSIEEGEIHTLLGENGDEYLKRIAEMLKQEAGENSILCRQGGDEFTLFYYKYGKEALVQKIEALKALQSGQKVRLRDGLTVDLRFSMGSSMAYGAVDYDKMYREADEKMYEDKRMRKKLAEETNTIES